MRTLRAPLQALIFAWSLVLVIHVHAQPANPLLQGRTYTTWLYQGDVDRLSGVLTPVMRQVVTPAVMREAWTRVIEPLGTELRMREERVIPLLAFRVYSRAASFERGGKHALEVYPFLGYLWLGEFGPQTADRFRLQWFMTADGRVDGFAFRPDREPAATRFTEYETRTALRLPFEGEWHVYSGGRSAAENDHAHAADQRFAYDFVPVRNSAVRTRDRRGNEAFYCFGQPVLAPGDGTVTAAVDGIADNDLLRGNFREPFGNHIVLDHGNGEFSVLAHLQRGSVQVKVGDRVRVGTRIARCGNSGNSSWPRLRYQLQNTPTVGRSDGLPAHFQEYVADGQPVSRGEPSRGQSVRNQ